MLKFDLDFWYSRSETKKPNLANPPRTGLAYKVEKIVQIGKVIQKL